MFVTTIESYLKNYSCTPRTREFLDKVWAKFSASALDRTMLHEMTNTHNGKAMINSINLIMACVDGLETCTHDHMVNALMIQLRAKFSPNAAC